MLYIESVWSQILKVMFHCFPTWQLFSFEMFGKLLSCQFANFEQSIFQSSLRTPLTFNLTSKLQTWNKRVLDLELRNFIVWLPDTYKVFLAAISFTVGYVGHNNANWPYVNTYTKLLILHLWFFTFYPVRFKLTGNLT